MTRARWVIVGAVLVGAAIFLYLFLFCPTECH